MRARVRGDDRLRRLPDAVSTALDKGADVDDRPVDCQRVRAEKTQYRLLQQPDTGPRHHRRAVRPLILADHCHVHNAVNARDERAAERCQKIFAVNRAHIVPEQIHGHPPRKRKKPDKEQTFQSAPYPAAVSLNSSSSSERGCYARRKMNCQAGKWLTRCPAACTRCP